MQIPVGWKLVPDVPTPEMIKAMRAPFGETSDGYPEMHDLQDKYFAALDHAPTYKEEQ